MGRWACRPGGYLAVAVVWVVAWAVAASIATPTGAIAAPPVHDSFSKAISLSAEVDSLSGSTFEATREPGEPEHAGDSGGASVWYAWTAPRSERIFMQVCAGGWDALVGVYRGVSLSGLSPVASSSSSPAGDCRQLRFRVTAAVAYRIAIDGYSAGGAEAAEKGGFELTLRTMTLALPKNDAFAQATVVEPSTFTAIYGTTEGANRESEEPTHGEHGASASVWYRWTAPQTTSMRIYPCGGDFDPAIGLYTGSDLAGLRSVGRAVPLEPWVRDCDLGGLGGIAFDAISGETYLIAVDSANGAWGSFRLSLGRPPLGLPTDVHPPAAYIRKFLKGRKGKVIFQLEVSERSAALMCRLDKRKFTPCSSPVVYRGLRPGWHRFAVKAVDPAGNVSPTPVVRRFKVSSR